MKIAVCGNHPVTRDILKFYNQYDKDAELVEIKLENLDQKEIATWFLDNSHYDYFIYTDFLPDELLPTYISIYDDILRWFSFYSRQNNVQFIALIDSIYCDEMVEKDKEIIKYFNSIAQRCIGIFSVLVAMNVYTEQSEDDESAVSLAYTYPDKITKFPDKRLIITSSRSVVWKLHQMIAEKAAVLHYFADIGIVSLHQIVNEFYNCVDMLKPPLLQHDIVPHYSEFEFDYRLADYRRYRENNKPEIQDIQPTIGYFYSYLQCDKEYQEIYDFE